MGCNSAAVLEQRHANGIIRACNRPEGLLDGIAEYGLVAIVEPKAQRARRRHIGRICDRGSAACWVVDRPARSSADEATVDNQLGGRAVAINDIIARTTKDGVAACACVNGIIASTRLDAIIHAIRTVDLIALRIGERRAPCTRGGGDQVAARRAVNNAFNHLVGHIDAQRRILHPAAPIHDADRHIIKVGAGCAVRRLEIRGRDKGQFARHGVQPEELCIRAAHNRIDQRIAIRIGRIRIHGKGAVFQYVDRLAVDQIDKDRRLIDRRARGGGRAQDRLNLGEVQDLTRGVARSVKELHSAVCAIAIAVGHLIDDPPVAGIAQIQNIGIGAAGPAVYRAAGLRLVVGIKLTPIEDERIRAVTGARDIASTDQQTVVACIAVQRVIAIATEDRVIAVAALDDIGATIAGQDVGNLVAGDEILLVAADRVFNRHAIGDEETRIKRLGRGQETATANLLLQRRIIEIDDRACVARVLNRIRAAIVPDGAQAAAFQSAVIERIKIIAQMVLVIDAIDRLKRGDVHGQVGALIQPIHDAPEIDGRGKGVILAPSVARIVGRGVEFRIQPVVTGPRDGITTRPDPRIHPVGAVIFVRVLNTQHVGGFMEPSMGKVVVRDVFASLCDRAANADIRGDRDRRGHGMRKIRKAASTGIKPELDHAFAFGAFPEIDPCVFGHIGQHPRVEFAPTAFVEIRDSVSVHVLNVEGKGDGIACPAIPIHEGVDDRIAGVGNEICAFADQR